MNHNPQHDAADRRGGEAEWRTVDQGVRNCRGGRPVGVGVALSIDHAQSRERGAGDDNDWR